MRERRLPILATIAVFILLYAFGVYTNLRTGNYLMAGIWFILIGVNLFFIARNRKWKK